MTKLALKGCAIGLYVLLAWASGIGSVQATEPGMSDKPVTPQQELSHEERMRRQHECYLIFKSCPDECKKQHPKNATKRAKCVDVCNNKGFECLRKIPPSPEPAYTHLPLGR